MVLAPSLAQAQIDYRNLDDDRPAFIEDAYPIERYAFELLAPWRYERPRGGRGVHLFIPELAYGVVRDGHVGFKLPIASAPDADGRVTGLAGLRFFGLYTLTTETTGLPGLGVRFDAALPVGGLAGASSRAGVKVLATRSYGAYRVHANVGGSVGGNDAGVGEPLPRWSVGGAVDRTLVRNSLLLIAEVYALRHAGEEHADLVTSVGGRWQFTPTLVLDAGVGRRLTSGGPNLALTIGISHAFALPGLMPLPGGGT